MSQKNKKNQILIQKINNTKCKMRKIIYNNKNQKKINNKIYKL